MVLALVDDLMFRSRIKSTAAQVGVDVAFAASRDAALEAMKHTPPTLLVVDLNSRRMDPIEAITAVKQDNALVHVKVVGFVSHIDVNIVAAARAAGTDEVMARSAFVARLPELLRTGS